MFGLVSAAIGYLIGRLRPYERLYRWNWKRTTFGPSTKWDWYLWATLHPVRVGKAFARQKGWMKPVEKPKPVDLNEIFFKGE